jgi:site-specific DNA-adenine methylase
MNKPFETYNGGKEGDGTYQKIISIMPPHDIYCELFLGNGAIQRKKKPAKYSILMDLDRAVINRWNEMYKNDGADRNAINLVTADAIQFLQNFRVTSTIFKNMGIRVLIYLDPPYPMDSRSTKRDRYFCEMTDDQHRMLMLAVQNFPANIVISSYPNPIYAEALSDWSTFTFTASTRGGIATEQVWYNYPQPTELHDYRYIGADYRERELIAGRIARNTAKFNRMNPIERAAILESILGV